MEATKEGGWDRILDIDWTSPLPYIAMVTVGLGFYAGGHFMKIGIFLGFALALGLLVLLHKSPKRVRRLCLKHPFIADVTLTTFGVMLSGGLFGTGLTLCVAFATCAVVLSFSIPSVAAGKARPA